MAAKSPIKRAVILTALEVETRAVLRHLPEMTDEAVHGTVFYRGQFDEWDIAIAEVGIGNSAAAVIAERAIRHFEPRAALFVGVAGGIKDVQIGDVVVGTKVYGYERGKEHQDRFLPRGDSHVANHALEQRARATRLRGAWKSRLDPQLSNEKARIEIGPIAAGEKVIASTRGPIAAFLKQNYSDALAVEMEGRGFLEGVHVNPEVQGCVIRGISDLLEGKSEADTEGSQARAADAASAVAFELLSRLDGFRGKQFERNACSASPVRRVPLSVLREWAVIDGWSADIQSATVGDNDWGTFTKRLRQAAVDGAMSFWGRKYVNDFGKALDDEPLVQIPREHFEEFCFRRHRICTGR
jgi:nucleoside phosphorylase